MIALHVTPAAYVDLQQIEAYLLERSAQATQRVMSARWARFEELVRHPFLGHKRADVDLANVRFSVVYSYVIVYRPREFEIEVLRVIHGARDIAALLEHE